MSRRAWLLLGAGAAIVAIALGWAAVTGGSVEVNASHTETAKQLDACTVFTTPDAQALFGPSAWGTRPEAGGTCSYLSGPPVVSPGSPPPTLVTINIYDGEPLSVADSYD